MDTALEIFKFNLIKLPLLSWLVMPPLLLPVLTCGVPKGPTFGPLLLCECMLPVRHTKTKFSAIVMQAYFSVFHSILNFFLESMVTLPDWCNRSKGFYINQQTLFARAEGGTNFSDRLDNK